MARTSRKGSGPGMAGSSADARGETGTGADATSRPGSTPSIGDLAGNPSTVDAGVRRRLNIDSDTTTTRKPVDRDRPSARDVGMDGGKASSVKPARSPGELAESDMPPADDDDDSPLESLGKAISSPVIDASEDNDR